MMHVKANQCQYGFMSKDAMGNGLVRKATGFMTNSLCVVMKLEKRCPNRNGKVQHRHVRLESGRTKAAQICPDGLCRAICQGIIQQLEMDRQGQFVLAQLSGIEQEKKDVERQLDEEYPTAEQDDSYALEQAWDDFTGAELSKWCCRSLFCFAGNNAYSSCSAIR